MSKVNFQDEIREDTLERDLRMLNLELNRLYSEAKYRYLSKLPVEKVLECLTNKEKKEFDKIQSKMFKLHKRKVQE